MAWTILSKVEGNAPPRVVAKVYPATQRASAVRGRPLNVPNPGAGHVAEVVEQAAGNYELRPVAGGPFGAAVPAGPYVSLNDVSSAIEIATDQSCQIMASA